MNGAASVALVRIAEVAGSPNWTEIVTAALLAAQLVVLVVAALVAWSQTKEAKRLREDQSRPFVVMDVDYTASSLLFLFVKNIGTSLARDVSIQVDPPLTTSLDFEMGAIKMLSGDGIPTLAPGKELRTLFDMGFRRHEAGLPLLYSVMISYTDHRGKRKFSESTFLDIEQYTHMRFVERKDIHNVYKAMEKMQRTFDKWTSGAWGGLQTISRAEADVKNAEWRKEREAEDDGEQGEQLI